MSSKNKPVSLRVEQVSTAAGLAEDRRGRSPRVLAEGQVLLLFSDPIVSTVEAELQDVSEGGFRVCHRERRLASGLQVRFCWRDSAGIAIVAWTRQLGSRFESGFSIKERWPSP